MYFFTEPEKLISQTQESYGPDIDDIANKYHTGTLFKFLTEAKIFACQNSMMIVQPHIGVDGNIVSSLVNIILKPNTGLDIPFSPVKYYIYRGISKSSLIVGNDIAPSNEHSTEFITKFWNNWNNYLSAENLDPQSTLPPTPISFGFENISLPTALPSTTLIEEIYNSEESTNNLVNQFQSIHVNEGEWIANVSIESNFIFEVITDTDHLVIDLAYVRKFQNMIDVSTLNNNTAEEKFIVKAEKEKILNYIDPAALFGMFYEAGINISTFQNSIRTPILKKESELYTEILEKFYTKNRVYLDIRSERGYSYNYYNNYGDENGNIIKALRKQDNLIAESGTTSFNPIYNYHNYNNWPIFCVDTITGSEASIENSTYNHVEIELRVDDNLKPVLFIENPKILGENNKSCFIEEKELVEETNIDWTNNIKIQYPNYNSSAIKLDVAYYVKLQYFRKEDNILSPNTVLKSETYLDAVFGGVFSTTINISSVFQNDKKAKRHFINGGDDNFQYVSENNLIADSNQVLFLTYNNSSLKKSSNVYPTINLSHFESNSINENYILPTNIIYNKWEVNDGTNNIPILEIVGYNKQDAIATPMEDIFMLGLTETEWETLNSISDVSNLHHKYLVFEQIANQFDVTNNTVYNKYKLKVQGLDNKGEVIISHPSSDIFVYGSSLNLLASNEFGNNTIESSELPDPGMEGPYKRKKISYNGSDVDVQAVVRDGIVKIGDDKINTGGYPNLDINVELVGDIYLPIKNTNDYVRECPLIVIIHGNGQYYRSYETLAKHLVSHGFVVNVISCLFKEKIFKFREYSGKPPYTHRFFMEQMYYYNINATNEQKFGRIKLDSTEELIEPIALTGYQLNLQEGYIIFDQFQNAQGMGIEGRAKLLNYHLQIIRKKFPLEIYPTKLHILNNIGLLGHSRGGEAVLIAARNINYFKANPTITNARGTVAPPDSLNNISSLASLAPTDAWGQMLDINIPYYVLYGSKDGDVKEAQDTGFCIWENHDVDLYKNEKIMSFVYKASHNGFITNNSDYPETDTTKILSPSIQKSISNAYFNAFFLKTLKGEDKWNRIFQGLIPKSIQTKEIYPQYRNLNDSQGLVIEDFEKDTFRLDNNIATFNYSTYLMNMYKNIDKQNEELRELFWIRNSAHMVLNRYCIEFDTKENGYLEFTISNDDTIDVSNFNYISFRIAHVFQYDNIYCDLSNVQIELIDSGGMIAKSNITQQIPIPDRRQDIEFSKTAFTSIIIPLGSNFINTINKNQIKKIKIIFPSSQGKEIIFKDLDFFK